MCPKESPDDRDEEDVTWTGSDLDEEADAAQPGGEVPAGAELEVQAEAEPEREEPQPEPGPRTGSIAPPGAEAPSEPAAGPPPSGEGGLLDRLRRKLGR